MKSPIELFKEGYNCSQSVFAPLAQELIPNEHLSFQMMSPFGGGISGTNGICGAITGAIAAIGLNTGHSSPNDNNAKEVCSKKTKLFLKEFTKQHGATSCTNLIGFNLSSVEEKEQAINSGVFKSKCPKFVESAAIIAQKIILKEL